MLLSCRIFCIYDALHCNLFHFNIRNSKFSHIHQTIKTLYRCFVYNDNFSLSIHIAALYIKCSFACLFIYGLSISFLHRLLYSKSYDPWTELKTIKTSSAELHLKGISALVTQLNQNPHWNHPIQLMHSYHIYIFL